MGILLNHFVNTIKLAIFKRRIFISNIPANKFIKRLLQVLYFEQIISYFFSQNGSTVTLLLCYSKINNNLYSPIINSICLLSKNFLHTNLTKLESKKQLVIFSTNLGLCAYRTTKCFNMGGTPILTVW